MDELTEKITWKAVLLWMAMWAVIVMIIVLWSLIPGGEQCDCHHCMEAQEQAEWERDNDIRSDGGTDGW